MSEQNLLIIGGGPGGYAAAFLAADRGMNVTLVDEESRLGGVCLLRGCIPSKTLLHMAKLISEVRHAGEWGLDFGVTVDPAGIMTGSRRGSRENARRLVWDGGVTVSLRPVNAAGGRVSIVNHSESGASPARKR